MAEESVIAFRLPCGLPAVSAVRTDGESGSCPAASGGFAAVDGQTRTVWLFSTDGIPTGSVETVRPYETLSRVVSSPSAGTYLASSRCGVRNRAYLLDCRFGEIGSIDLLTATQDCNDADCLTDLSSSYENGEPRIDAAFRRTVRSFDYGGEQVELLLRAERGRVNLHYTASGTARALHFSRDRTEFVNVAELGAVYLGVVPPNLTLRGFLPSGAHDVYGLFGYRYLYNYLIPLYRNGVFLLPANGEIDRILQSFCGCPLSDA